MKEKNAQSNALISQKEINEIIPIVEKKCNFFQDVIQKTLINVKKNKILNILGISDVNDCVKNLNKISESNFKLLTNMKKMNKEEITNSLQTINNELSVLFKMYGTESLDDLLTICYGNNNNILTNEDDENKYELIRKYFHPTSYKIINFNNKGDNEEKYKIKNLECDDISHNHKQFHMKVYGVRIYLYHNTLKKNMVIYGILDDVMLEFLQNKYITSKIKEVNDNKPQDEEFKSECFNKFLDSFTLKDFLINESCNQIYEKYIGLLSNHKLIKQKTLNNLIKEFIIGDLFNKRNTIMQLLIESTTYDNKYLAYLLYDLLSNDVNGTIDTQEQTTLFDSFPWNIKNYFRDAMKNTVEYTNSLSNFDINKIPLEQQICLLKANDNVKEKAMMKLKEVKAKSEDSGSKARQYLDGLLKIPFEVYIKEPVMDLMQQNNKLFIDLLKKVNDNSMILKDKYTNIEILNYLKNIKGPEVKDLLEEYNKSELVELSVSINKAIIINKFKFSKIKHSNTTKEVIKKDILKFFEYCNDCNEIKIIDEIIPNNLLKNNINKINTNFNCIKKYMNDVKTTLDSAVHGHKNAKKQIERIIGQWINGTQDGYCFGFEGPPGLGKTSLAKRGLAACLKNENGENRPFSMIQMGGDSNGSSLHGHNYTYVGSTWGSIVQILIDSKCMNPIILIDEVDKISKTEHGKEIIGILTHLLDPAQNDCFQDKYFTGVDLNLSKALFILSYNDADAIDKILLDRIHRIKFKSLSVDDKLIIVNTHILPEVYKKMGLEGIINISDDVIKFIIEEYTYEAGVRKLKEIMFEVVGEINLDILKNEESIEIPIIINKDDIKNKYFKDKQDIKIQKISDTSQVGTINGLWANALGQGGIIPIQANWFPSDKFMELKLTGMQGDVMKESMNVALTLAWNLVSPEIKNQINENKQLRSMNGIHVHCPEGSVPKDGPSAGAAITTVIYSLLTMQKIRNDIAMTGEISLDGTITQIGGLDLKIIGGIKGGVKEFIYPEENEKDFQNFMEKYKDSDLVKNVKFNKVKKIQEVFELLF
uniref:Lon proteolytic domain-containing protein n=1 Tax=viral metagenome TaxID=1070528 RepID=A0A6C0KX12_9ZZZZ